MRPAENDRARKRFSWKRCAVAMVAVGVVLIVFVAASGGEYGAWTMWIALPLLMIGLGYIFVINAIPVFLSYSSDDEAQKNAPERDHEK